MLPGGFGGVGAEQRRTTVVLLAITVGLFAGLALAPEYQTALLAQTDQQFGDSDPIFDRDISFYVFELPFWWLLWEYALFAGIVALVAGVAYAWHDYLAGGRQGAALAAICSAPVTVVVGLLAALAAIGVWLSRYSLLTRDNSDSSVHVGASYIDGTGLLSTLNDIYVSAAVAVGIGIGLVILANALRREDGAGRRRALTIIGVLLLVDFGFRGAVALRAEFFVKPNEPVIQLEAIANHIEATRKGAQLERIERIPYAPGRPGDPLPPIDTILESPEVENLPLWPGFSSYLERLLDPQHSKRVLTKGGSSLTYGPTLEAAQQAQKLRAYYRFMGMDFARYNIDGKQRMVVSGVRELPLYEPVPWLGYFGQRYMLYTHGYGMVMAPANEVTPEGGLNFVMRDIPTEYQWDEVRLDNERVYYGEGAATMAFSNVDRMEELDYPTDTDRAVLTLPASDTTAIANDSLLKRVVFGWRSGHLIEFLFSDLITDQTRVHYYRRPIERLERIAPFLYFDTNVYAVSAEGRIQWMVNALATSDVYPYARYGELGDQSDQRSPYPEEHRYVNYVEDAAKVVIDGYSGQVSFYKVSDEPLINAWDAIYPGLFQPMDAMPSSLKEQVTYSPHLFHYQFDDLFIYYHMNDPMYFFNLEDMWDDADEVLGALIDQGNAVRFSVETYPLITRTGGHLPEASTPTQYSQLLVFTPEKALNLRGVPVVYQDWPDYGRISVLEVPKGRYVMGPEQADALIDQDPEISAQFALWNRRGLDVIRGHTVTLPLEDEVIYVEPIFLRSQQNEVPQLQRVAVVFRDQVAMGNTFEAALRSIYERIKSGRHGGDVPQVSSAPITNSEQEEGI